jgi:homoserine kinase
MNMVQLRLPATSANLGPGFDALALALDLYLEIEAVPAAEFGIDAFGRNQDICGGLTKNLLIETYKLVLAEEQRPLLPLALRVKNGIPVGMGCGSSAAVRLAGVALASAFGGLDWDAATIVERAVRLEGHPDNVAACWYGGLTIAASAQRLAVVSLPPPRNWRAVLVLPESPVATSKARGLLPPNYDRQDVVMNLQCVALLTAAFALGRADLMQLATRDRLHQPYRAEICPLLPALLPLAGSHGVISITLSGAGPAVMLLIEDGKQEGNQAAHGVKLSEAILQLARPVCPVEILAAGLNQDGSGMHIAMITK